MNQEFFNGCVMGVERVAAWADLLDRINVFPVADGDTGRNLILSLTPLRERDRSREDLIERVLLAARGNSGNIAARFLSGFLTADSVQAIPGAAKQGRDQAWSAVHDPVPGTMLSVLDALVASFEKHENVDDPESTSEVVALLERAVWSTTDQIPKLKEAGVVDAGALGMFIFLEGFFCGLLGETEALRSISSVFKDRLRVSPEFREEMGQGWCLDLVVRPGDAGEIEGLSDYGESVVVIPHEEYVKVHLHTDDAEAALAGIGAAGEIVRWEADDLDEQVKTFTGGEREPAVHIMTDAAGSVTREDARRLGLTLLDSYIIAGDRSAPETLFDPSELYRLMRQGVKISTAQASVFERHQHYRGVLDQHPRVLYLCVGSVYTGNYQTAMAWKKENDPENRFTVIDTGAAAGRLGAIAMAAAEYAARAEETDAVARFARAALEDCEEYIFLDRLRYLAAGGRLSKTSAFFGEMFHVKPIISPLAEGAKKVGAVKNQAGQIAYALEKLGKCTEKEAAPYVMLQYSDNREWVNETVKKEIERLRPHADVLLQPLSLTSGVHMGPGTWGVAILKGK